MKDRGFFAFAKCPAFSHAALTLKKGAFPGASWALPDFFSTPSFIPQLTRAGFAANACPPSRYAKSHPPVLVNDMSGKIKRRENKHGADNKKAMLAHGFFVWIPV